jgi:hypothetical protein
LVTAGGKKIFVVRQWKNARQCLCLPCGMKKFTAKFVFAVRHRKTHGKHFSDERFFRHTSWKIGTAKHLSVMCKKKRTANFRAHGNFPIVTCVLW